MIMKKYFLLLLTSLVFFTSCEDDFLDINTNPNRSTSVPPGTLMMNAAISLSQVRLTGLNPDGAAYIQHWKPIVVLRDPDTYEFGEIPNNNFWEFTFYQDVIKDLNLAIGAAEADDNQNVVAQLRLLQAFGWIHGVDRWGTMPFDQAVNSEFQFPEYNTGPEIYQGILDLIDGIIRDYLKIQCRNASCLLPYSARVHEI